MAFEWQAAVSGSRGVASARRITGSPRSRAIEARFRFYEELNDHLPAALRKKELTLGFPEPVTVKEAFVSVGVPPGEVDLVLVNGESAGFSRWIKDGDRVSVYPVFERFDISGLTRVRTKPLRDAGSGSRTAAPGAKKAI